jgi:PIN domain nuclease of toxin-antitoxin system
VKLLLDTHTLLWFVAGATQLSDTARAAIEAPENEALVSVASLWEMAIKVSLGKLDLGMPFEEFVADHVVGNGMEILDISPAHVSRVVSLPFHHRDPFDRLLIAQAQEEAIAIVGRDHAFGVYGVTLVW